MPKLSVIVTVYNLERFILRCLESIKQQTFTDYEVIIINDESTDKSAEIIESFIAEGNLDNFTLINKTNGGISSARNKGIEKAKGQWITFIDGDDWVEPCFFENLFEGVLPETQLSIVAYQYYDMHSQKVVSKTEYTIENGKIPDNLGDLYSFGKVWARMYRRDIIEENNICFDERIAYCEDNAFNFDYIKLITNFKMSNKVGYNYRVNYVGSLTSKLIHPKIKEHLDEHMQSFCSEFELVDIKAGIEKNRNLSFVMWNVLHTTVTNFILDKKLKEAYHYKKTELSRNIIKYYKPKAKKDILFRFLFRTSFLGLIILVKIYYGNFQKMRNSKFLRFMS